MNAAPFLSCDWGTSSFRLRWVEPGRVVAREKTSGAGCKWLHDQALERGEDWAGPYERTLSEALGEWEGLARRPLPLVISGMASSTVGWREIPYLNGSLRLDGSNLRFEKMRWNAPAWVSETFLISGVAIHPEMMRGEETEAVGVMSALKQESGTLVLPGTHSKHLRVRNGEIAAIATYMTGELYDLLARQSLLKASVDPTGSVTGSAFEEGVGWAKEHGLSKGLFRVRTRAVLDGTSATENASFLSGLLIGDELRDLESAATEIILAGAGPFAELYSRAFTALAFPVTLWSVVPETIMNQAVITAHAMFLNTHQ
jgi:2-dehydro-3-deoxygalactonokinase